MQSSFTKIFNDLNKNGKYYSPRGQLTKEILDYQYTLKPYERFCNFPSRKLNVNYIKKEFLWYLTGDRFNQDILAHAGMWKSLIQEDGGFNSNYGQYLFADDCAQFKRAAEILSKDADSRRASIVILQPKHILTDTTDQPCTYSINFAIRDNKLRMKVNMRSQDGFWGMGNDAPCFSFIHEMMFNYLLAVYPELEYGEYVHNADSFHIYSRHFNAMDECLNENNIAVECPKISGYLEVESLLNKQFDTNFNFTKWLSE